MPSSNKAKRPTDHKKATSKKAYGNKWKSPLSDLDLPSGEVCQVRRPGIQGLIKAGILHSLDSLTAIVSDETIPKAAGKPVTAVDAIMHDPKKFSKMMEQTDKIVCFVVTQPKVLSNMVPVWKDKDKTEQELDGEGEKLFRELTDEEGEALVAEYEATHDGEPAVMVDWVDTNDKMFIMNYAVGGSADLAEFRQATEALVGGVPVGEAASPKAE